MNPEAYGYNSPPSALSKVVGRSHFLPPLLFSPNSILVSTWWLTFQVLPLVAGSALALGN